MLVYSFSDGQSPSSVDMDVRVVSRHRYLFLEGHLDVYLCANLLLLAKTNTSDVLSTRDSICT